MPCYNPGPWPDTREDELRKKLPAMLCAILTVLETRDDLWDVLSGVDEREAGIYVDDILEWWDNHKEADRKRIGAIIEANRKANLRNSARSKLTEEELEALTEVLKG